jgi:hypothetical protein
MEVEDEASDQQGEMRGSAPDLPVHEGMQTGGDEIRRR